MARSGFIKGRGLLVLLSASLCSGLGMTGAQPASPVYPVYEGYTPNPDGSFTLVFGYYNANPVEVEIPAGEDNGFTPPPLDRGQPVRFSPGRQRNVCLMVVPEDFSYNLRWTLSQAGHSLATTERGGLDSLYLLEEIGSAYRAARQLDHEAVARAVCINRPPTVRAGRDREATVGTPLELRGSVWDEGLPRGGDLQAAWSWLSGPSRGVVFADPESPVTTVTFPTVGTYELRLSATDGEKEAEDALMVEVGP